MLDMILGLTLGAVITMISAMSVHKMIEYGKKHGIVQLDRDDQKKEKH